MKKDMNHVRTIERSTVFHAEKHKVFILLKDLKTLQYIAWPFATFEQDKAGAGTVWEPGLSYSFRFKLMGFIPFGTHRITVVRFSENEGILTHERNEHVPVWNHEITLRDTGNGTCEYTDRVLIGAGRSTVFVWLWARCFYAHRQRKWNRLLIKTKNTTERGK